MAYLQEYNSSICCRNHRIQPITFSAWNRSTINASLALSTQTRLWANHELPMKFLLFQYSNNRLNHFLHARQPSSLKSHPQQGVCPSCWVCYLFRQTICMMGNICACVMCIPSITYSNLSNECINTGPQMYCKFSKPVSSIDIPIQKWGNLKLLVQQLIFTIQWHIQPGVS